MTEISRDIVVDLLPLYLADEISPAGRQAVEEFLNADAELAAYVHTAKAESSAERSTRPKPSADLEMRSVQKTRKVLRLQRWLFALAIAFTSVGLSTGIQLDNGRITGARLVAFDHPAALVPALIAAAICWLMYLRLRRTVS